MVKDYNFFLSNHRVVMLKNPLQIMSPMWFDECFDLQRFLTMVMFLLLLYENVISLPAIGRNLTGTKFLAVNLCSTLANMKAWFALMFWSTFGHQMSSSACHFSTCKCHCHLWQAWCEVSFFPYLAMPVHCVTENTNLWKHQRPKLQIQGRIRLQILLESFQNRNLYS